MTTQIEIDWRAWLKRWDAQQEGYLPDREARFNVMFDVLDALLPADFVALDLGCGPGAISQRLLKRFPCARAIAVDLDPVLLVMGQSVLGTMDGRLRWVETDLRRGDWVSKLGETQVHAVLSATALHWLPAADLVNVYRALGALVSPGGVVLNGDHIDFSPSMAAFQQVSDKVYTRIQDDAFKVRGVEDWERWWDALAREPGAQELLAERTRRFAWMNENERGRAPIIDLHQAALRDAGFGQVGVIWQHLHNRVLMAVR